MGGETFTGLEAREYAQQGRIEEWVHLFLNSAGGNNAPFSEGLRLQRRFWTGPVLLPLCRLARCCGPEPGMEFVVPQGDWDRHVLKLQTLVQQGWDMPPLIASSSAGRLTINDGNHRYEALVREGISESWVIIWDS